MKWYIEVLRKYAVFGGRARRMEYWMFNLLNLIIAWLITFIEITAGLADSMGEFGPLSWLYMLALIVPHIAVTVRRLHDTDRSGWWNFIILVPLIGVIVLVVFMAQDSKPGENRFGVNPKEASA
jgi:uncharacterized membrane protein YhaH (DUF805 family)